MTWASKHLGWLFPAIQHLNTVEPRRILQAVAIICYSFLLAVIIHKGGTDISLLAQEHPDDFWRELGRYLIDNMAGQGIGRGTYNTE